MATVTSKRKRRVTKKVRVEIKEPLAEVRPEVTEDPPKVVEKCYYCRESKYELSTTRCPVSTHTETRNR